MPLVFGGRVYAIFFSRILDAHLGPRPPWHQSKMHEYTGDSRILQHYDRKGRVIIYSAATQRLARIRVSLLHVCGAFSST